MRPVAVTGVGLVTPLGNDLSAVQARFVAGDTAVTVQAGLRGLPWDGAALVDGPDLGPWLKRKKDRKLMPRAAVLALPAAGAALAGFTGSTETLGLYVGVGREPPDEGESEAALVASQQGGRLDPVLLSTEGLACYPPLLPLKTLPNMILAWLSIVFGVHGPNVAVNGEAGAGVLALDDGLLAVSEGRAPAALVGAADSQVTFGAARDLYRLGRAGRTRPPGEGAVFFLLEPAESAKAPFLGWLDPVHRGRSGVVAERARWRATGDLGTADGLLDVAMALLGDAAVVVGADDDEGACAKVRVIPWVASPSAQGGGWEMNREKQA